MQTISLGTKKFPGQLKGNKDYPKESEQMVLIKAVLQQELLPTSPPFGVDSSRRSRGKAAYVRRFQVHVLIGGHCHEGGGELTRSEGSYMVGLGENRVFVWKRRH